MSTLVHARLPDSHAVPHIPVQLAHACAGSQGCGWTGSVPAGSGQWAGHSLAPGAASSESTAGFTGSNAAGM